MKKMRMKRTKIVVVLVLTILILTMFFALKNRKILNTEEFKIRREEFELSNVIVQKDETDRYYGLMDLNGNNITPYDYNFIGDFYAGTAIAMKDGKNNIIDETGKIIASDIGQVSRQQEYYIVSTIIEKEQPREEYIIPRENAVPELEAPIENTTEYKYGVLDSRGQVILNSDYSNIYLSGDMFVTSKLDGENIKTGIVNLFGKEILELKYDNISIITEGSYSIINGVVGEATEQYLFYSKTGTIISELQAQDIIIKETIEDKCILQITDGENIKNTYVYGTTLEELQGYTEPKLMGSYLTAQKDNKTYLLDSAGKEITELIQYAAYNKILAMQKDNNVEIYNDYNLIKTLENYKLEETYLDVVVTFNNNTNKYETYDENGNLCMESDEKMYQILTPDVFVKGNSEALELINKKGEKLNNGDYSNVIFQNVGEKFLKIQKDNKYGLYNIEKQELVLDIVYNQIEFSTTAKYITVDGSLYNYDGVKIK